MHLIGDPLCKDRYPMNITKFGNWSIDSVILATDCPISIAISSLLLFYFYWLNGCHRHPFDLALCVGINLSSLLPVL